MAEDIEDIRANLVTLPDDELVRIVTKDREQYRADAVDIARVELQRRSVRIPHIADGSMPVADSSASMNQWNSVEAQRPSRTVRSVQMLALIAIVVVIAIWAMRVIQAGFRQYPHSTFLWLTAALWVFVWLDRRRFSR